MEDNYKEPSVCDDCEIGDGWECQFCCYTFDEFYKTNEIENKWDMNVQVNAMRYLNMLLDEGIVELVR